jgi:hypothetical protein
MNTYLSVGHRVLVSFCVQISTRPRCILQQPLTVFDKKQVEPFSLCWCFPRCRLQYGTSLLVHKCVARTLTSSIHNDFVILATSFGIELIITNALLQFSNTLFVIIRVLTCLQGPIVTADGVVNEVLPQCLTKCISMSQNGKFNVLPCLLRSSIISKGGGHWFACELNVL